MLQRVIELLRPDVSTDAKLTGVSLLIGKTLESETVEWVKLGVSDIESI